ncbi:MAG: Maf family protein [Promethearchaeia archaeon]
MHSLIQILLEGFRNISLGYIPIRWNPTIEENKDFPVRVILASQSRDRKKLLQRIGIPFEIKVSNINEDKYKIEVTDPIKLVKVLAKQKAINVKKTTKKEPASLIIAADTIVEYKNRVIGKAKDKEDAFTILKELMGKDHRLLTGIAITHSQKDEILTDYDITKVTFSSLEDEQIRYYIQSNEWKGRAGAYSIREKASLFIEKIEGSPSNVIGFPMHKLYSLVKNTYSIDLLNF